MKIQNDTQSARIVLASTLVLVSIFLFAAITFPLQSGLLSGIFPKYNSLAAGSTYYVDYVSGNDASTGTTESTAWKTLSNINSRSFQPGDRILLKRGQTWNQGIKLNSSGTSGNPITIGAYGSGGLPTLNAAQKVTRTWTVHSGNIWKTDADIYIVRLGGQKAVWEQPETKLDKKGEWSRRHDANNNVTYIYAESDPNSYYGSSGIETSSTSYLVDLSNRKFIHVENLNLIGASSRAVYINNSGQDGNNVISGVRVEAPLYSGIEIEDSNYNRVESSTILNGATNGVIISKSEPARTSDNNIIIGNTVTGFSARGIQIIGYTSEYSANNNEILNNTSYDNGDGSYITYSKYTKVKGNHFYNNRRTESVAGEGYGVGVQSTSFAEISGNNLHDNRTRGVEVWGGQATAENPAYGRSDNNKIIGNRSYRNEMGFFFSSNYSSNSLVAYNFIYDNEKEGILWGHPDGQNNQIINNTFVGNSIGVNYYGDARITLKNNIFSLNGRAFNLTNQSSISNNGYFSNDVSQGGTTYSGTSIKTVDATAVLANPQFVDISAKDFHINSNSPLINMGIAINGLNTDIDGQSLIGAPDIGADEYSGQVITPTIPPVTINPTSVNNSPTPSVSITPTQTLSPTPIDGELNLKYKVWKDINTTDNALLTDLTNDPRYPDSPSSVGRLGNIDPPKNQGTNFGTRIEGYLKVPQTGMYIFYIAADDTGELWLGSNRDKSTARKIAENTYWVYPYEWTKSAAQKSVSIELVAGQEYYIEVIHAESIGEDHVSVGWIRPGQTSVEVIPSSAFSALNNEFGDSDINRDGFTDVFDLGILAAHYGQSISISSDELTLRCDINLDDTINVFDLGLLIGHYIR
ncbi:hypothetical protein HGA91_02750 [candidate division WWE3 bacterium]|nr:hypothetical protein [candidate division WWE3 bacterium]